MADVSASPPASRWRYNNVAQALHWSVAALMFGVIPLAWVAVSLPEKAPSTEFFFTLHKSVGLTILAIVAFRLYWRACHPAPPLPSHMAKWERAAAKTSHWLLYLILIGMPLSGYVVSTAGGHTVTFFNLFTLPALPKDKDLENIGMCFHVLTGQWLVYALILIHIGATAWHVAVYRDGVLGRMLPRQDDLEVEPSA